MTTLANPDAVLEIAVADMKRDFAARNPRSQAWHDEACLAMPGGNTRSNLFYSPFPLAMTSGEGAYLQDADGHRYVDFLCEYTAGAYGHSNARLLRALHEVSAMGLSLGAQNVWEGRFAQVLCERFPAIDQVRLTNSGTEANLCALGAARAFTGRDKIIVFEGAYHGGALTFTIPNNPLNVPFEVLIAQYNDPLSVVGLLDQNPGSVAALIIEPMLSSGGCIPGSKDFLREMRRLTQEAGVVLIFDEVVTSRLGAGGVHGDLAIRPDMVTLGKYIGGGLSCGAFGGSVDIMGQFNPNLPNHVAHAGTFNNNTLTVGVGYVALTEVFTPQEAERVNQVGERLRERLNALCAAADVRMQFTGQGSSMNLHFTDQEVLRPNAATRGHKTEKALYFFHLLSRGIFVAPRGMINVSLAHEARDIDALVEATSDFIERFRDLFSPLETERERLRSRTSI